jgi:Phospholipase_D-nuclease N-terminal
VILFHILTDLFRDHTLSGGMKTLWVVFLVFLPFLAALVYLISRARGWPSGPRPVSSRPRSSSKATSDRSPPPVTPPPPGPTRSPQAKQLLDAGTIDQAEFDRLKAKALT